ncbi:hypothetical protein CPB85DRAFT_624228 [Mucidula mucida]|nr:hypothetical protein CPB85DRAFT_624228 [Mucidula mucida]
MRVAQAAVEPVESMEDATNDSLVESEGNFASSQDVISPQVDGTQGSPDEGVALQEPEKVDNEPAVEVTPEDDMAVSRDLQNSVGEEESLLESGTEATPGPEGSQAVGNDSEVVVPEALSVVQEAEPVDELVSVENAPESVVAEAPPVEVAEESLVESADQEVTANGPELDSTQAEVVDEFPLVMEEAEPTDNLSAADSASEAVVPPGVALEEDLDHEVTEVEPQVDTVEANAVENESVDLAVEAPFVIENEEQPSSRALLNLLKMTLSRLLTRVWLTRPS